MPKEQNKWMPLKNPQNSDSSRPEAQVMHELIVQAIKLAKATGEVATAELLLEALHSLYSNQQTTPVIGETPVGH